MPENNAGICAKAAYLRVAATIKYDGIYGVPWFRSGLRHKFRLDDMPAGHFLPNMGTEVDGSFTMAPPAG